MTARPLIPLAVLASLAACNDTAAPDTANRASPETPPPANAEMRTAERDGRSAQAALALTRDYYALVEAKRFVDAAKLVRTGDAARLADKFGDYEGLRASVGPVGESDGAAGSIYITIFATVTATAPDGTETKIEEVVTLRRVNDVPGSTEAQRRWHIEGVDGAATNDRGP